jgi:hypothetical protein
MTSNVAQPSAGTTQATASVCVADHVLVPSVGAGEGVILKPANADEIRTVANGDATDSLLVYPPVGCSFNGSAANTALTLPAGRAAFFVFITPTQINATF